MLMGEDTMQAVKTITVPVYGLNFATCGQTIERRLGALPGVIGVDANYVTQTVTVTFDEHHLSEETVRSHLKDCGFTCGDAMRAEGLLQAGAQFQHLHSSAISGVKDRAPAAQHFPPHEV